MAYIYKVLFLSTFSNILHLKFIPYKYKLFNRRDLLILLSLLLSVFLSHKIDIEYDTNVQEIDSYEFQ